jgi:hypothetical protein
LISSMSWLMIVIQILAEVRGYYKERKDRWYLKNYLTQ